MLHAKISGVGCFLPETVLTNFDLEKMVETSDEWIIQRTGIRGRRISGKETYTSELAAKAAEEALRDAQITAEELDFIIVTTVSGEMIVPSTACTVQKQIGAKSAAAMDLNAACTGFIYALTVAEGFIRAGMYKNILVIGADCLSKVTNYQDRKTCILFGDGAGAAVLTASEGETGILQTVLKADGTGGDCLTLPFLKVTEEEVKAGTDRKIYMDGSEVFKFAVRAMAELTKEALEKQGLTTGQLDVLIPHQANMRIVEGAVKRLKIDKERVFTNLDRYGNMSNASIPVALCEAVREGRMKPGDNVVLVGFGGGLTCGAALIKW